MRQDESSAHLLGPTSEDGFLWPSLESALDEGNWDIEKAWTLPPSSQQKENSMWSTTDSKWDKNDEDNVAGGGKGKHDEQTNKDPAKDKTPIKPKASMETLLPTPSEVSSSPAMLTQLPPTDGQQPREELRPLPEIQFSTSPGRGDGDEKSSFEDPMPESIPPKNSFGDLIL